MRWLGVIVALAAPTAALAEPVATVDVEAPDTTSVADLSAGLGLVGISTGGTGNIDDDPGSSAAAFVSGDVFVGQLARPARVDVGFTFRYLRTATFATTSGGLERDSRFSAGAIGAVARRDLGGQTTIVARLELGRSRYRVDGAAAGFDYRSAEVLVGLAKKFETLRFAAELGGGAAVDHDGAERGSGLLGGGRLEVGFALSESVELETAASARWQTAGAVDDRQTRLDVGFAVSL